MSTESHVCTKKGCFYCYEMARINTPKPEYEWPKKSTYEYQKERHWARFQQGLKSA